MANRKATFAKRQRESDLKDHARAKEARRAARQDAPRTEKGPQIAWDEAVYPAGPAPADGTAGPTDPNADPAAPPVDNLPAPTPPRSDDSA
jgi:hypothetical protein